MDLPLDWISRDPAHVHVLKMKHFTEGKIEDIKALIPKILTQPL